MNKIYYINGYTIDLICVVIHEISHWIVALLFYLLRLIVNKSSALFPTIHCIQQFSVEENCIKDWSMHVKMQGNNFEIFLVCIAPVFTTVILLVISYQINIYLFLLILTKVETLWLSESDYKNIKETLL